MRGLRGLLRRPEPVYDPAPHDWIRENRPNCAALHYEGTADQPGPESDFPRAPASWFILADGSLEVALTFRGGTVKAGDLWVGFWTGRDGGDFVTAVRAPEQPVIGSRYVAFRSVRVRIP